MGVRSRHRETQSYPKERISEMPQAEPCCNALQWWFWPHLRRCWWTSWDAGKSSWLSTSTIKRKFLLTSRKHKTSWDSVVEKALGTCSSQRDDRKCRIPHPSQNFLGHSTALSLLFPPYQDHYCNGGCYPSLGPRLETRRTAPGQHLTLNMRQLNMQKWTSRDPVTEVAG